jgi:phosphoribosylformylglycinamidine (FGAM) synthase PurS component
MDTPPIPQEILDAFAALELPVPSSVPLMTISFQIAQKLHGLTEEGSTRVQDLIDLQLMAKNETLDLKKIRAICRRLFANRKKQQWTSRIVKGEKWDEIYQEGCQSIKGLMATVDEAIVWANDLIKRIEG